MKSFDEIAAKKANGGTLTPLETISLEGPCIDNQKRLNAFNRAMDTADRELQELTATISSQGAEVDKLEKIIAFMCHVCGVSDKQLKLIVKRSKEVEYTA